MKRFFVLAAIAFFAFAAFADEAQPTPMLNDPLLKRKVQVLQRAVAVAVVENEQRRGVVVYYDTIYEFVRFKYKPGSFAYLGNYQENKSIERVFITGLDHDKITTNGILYHFIAYQGEHFLYAWPIGIEKMTVNGTPVRLKKFTVDPTQAAAYYKAKGGSKVR